MAPPKPLSLGGGTPAAAPQAPAASPAPVAPSYSPPVAVAAPSYPAPVAAPAYSPPAVVAPPGGAVLTMESISQVGLTAQRSVSDISKQLGMQTKTSQLDELGKLMGTTMMAVKGYDPANTKGGMFGWFKRKVEEVRLSYETAETTVGRLVAQMNSRLQLHQQRDTAIEQMQAANRKAHADLGNDIATLTAKLDWMEANPPVITDPTDVMQGQRVQQWNTIVAMGRKHADDLARSRAVCEVFEPQLEMFKQQGMLLTQKLRSFETTTLPVLRQTFFNYIIMLEQEATAKMTGAVDDLTDNAMKENARKMGQTTVAVHTALNRSSVSIEALQANYTATTQALDDIDRLRSEMKTRLANEAPQIEAASRALAARLTQQAV